MRIKGVTLTVAILLSLVGLLSGLYLAQHLHLKNKIDRAEFHGTYLENPRIINQFNLTGIDGKPFSNLNLQGHWTLFFFGFTNCGYLCPTTMAELSKMYKILEKKEVKNLPLIVMISLDPERDNLDQLGHYVTSFYPSFYGARGDEKAIQLMAREMGIAFGKVAYKDSTAPQNYDIEHSGALILLNPHGEINAFFTTPHHADLLAKDYMLLIS